MRTLLLLVLLGTIVLELVLYRKDFRRARAAQREWRNLAVVMPAEDRREVSRAVRQGRPVAEPRLAPAAVTLAEAVVVSRSRGPLRTLNLTLALVWFSIPAVVAATEGRWSAAVGMSIVPLLFLATVAVGIWFGKRAGQALVTNRGLSDDVPPATAAP